MTWSSSSRACPVVLAAFALSSAAQPAMAPAQREQGGLQLVVPVACDMARDCSIQKYVDRAAGPERLDYRCGSLTTDGHRGTDLRLRRFEDMERDVKILAAAAGTVLRVRDAMPDVSTKQAVAPLPPDRWAGNAVVIGHGDGWETQYSHLRRGSLRVRPGQSVPAGAELGVMGLSGQTEFPHLHFDVRHKGEVVDPFAADMRGGCGKTSRTLWTTAAAQMLAYRPTVLLAAGFVTAPTNIEANIQKLEPDGAMTNPDTLILWGNVSGVQSGDVETFHILAPNGGLLVARERPIVHNSLLWVSYLGSRRPLGGWQAGLYTGTYRLTRNGVFVGEQAVSKYISE